MRGVRLFCVALFLLGGLVAAPAALGAFPGGNGRIVVQTVNGLDTINSAGGERQHLIGEIALFATPTWSADGTRVAFVTNRVPPDLEIYSIGAQGNLLTPVTNNTVDDSDPSWSPDGSRIVFARVADMASPSQLFVINANGTGEAQLIPGLFDDSAPAWSPDGTRIAFARATAPGGNADIWTTPANGGSPTPLTTDLTHETNPDWSPDGSRIVFQRGDTIVVMSASGADQTPLPVPPGAQRPAWSPDGTRILFDVAQEVWSVNPNGTGATRLTTAGGPTLVAQAPSWQPIPQGGPGAPGPGGDNGPGTSAPLLRRSLKASLRTNRAGRYTVFAKLSVSPVRPGDTLRLTCKGRGCPFKRVSLRPKRSRASISLLSHLRGAKLRKGAVVQLLVSRRATIGRATTWKIRAPKSPRVIRSCLRPGKSKLTRCPR